MNYSDKIQEFLLLKKAGKQTQVNKLLKEFLEKRYEIAFILDDAKIAHSFMIALLQILSLDLCEDEDEEMDVAKLSYFIISKIINETTNEEIKIECLRLRIILLNSFGELLLESIIRAFYTKSKYNSDEYMAQRNLCSDYIIRMQISDTYIIDDISEGKYSDSLLNDIFNSLEKKVESDEKEIKEAELIHKILHAYIKVGYKKH